MTARRVWRNLVIAAAVSIACSIGYLLASRERPVESLSLATAYVAIALLVMTLSIGPVNLMRERPNPVSTHFRRDLGIWSALLATVHTLLGLQVHMGGDIARYFTFPRGAQAGLVTFVAANYMGLLANFILLLLTTLSNDFSLRLIGTLRWKSLQRWSYAGLALVAVHAALFQGLETRNAAGVILLGLIVVVAVALQLRGRALHTKKHLRI